MPKHSEIEIGAYEAKAHLSEYLQKVARGAHFTITRRGERMAELVPVEQTDREDGIRAAEKMQAFMQRAPQAPEVDTKALIEEGRD